MACLYSMSYAGTDRVKGSCPPRTKRRMLVTVKKLEAFLKSCAALWRALKNLPKEHARRSKRSLFIDNCIHIVADLQLNLV